MPDTGKRQLDQLQGYMARHYWVASRAELNALGFPTPTIDKWLESGRLVPQFRGVYSFGRDIETADSAWRAALLAAGPGAVLSGRSACELWGLVRPNQAWNNQARGNQAWNNQARGNQAWNNQARGNQAWNNQARGNQAWKNQARGNQAQNNQARGTQAGSAQAQSNRARGKPVWGNGAQAIGAIPSRIEVASGRRKAIRFTGRSAALSRTRVEVVHRSFEEGECRRRDGLEVTSAPRALIDYAAEADRTAVRFAFLEACRLGLFVRRDVDYCFRRIEGRRGATRIRPLLALWIPELGRIRSVLEGLFLLAWVARDRRLPRVNVKVSGYEVDCYWPEQGLVVELDGGAFHSDPLARDRDAAKDRILRDAGLRVRRFDYDTVRDAPEPVVREVKCLLDASRDE